MTTFIERPPNAEQKEKIRIAKMREAYDTIHATGVLPIGEIKDEQLDSTLQGISDNLDSMLNMWKHKVRQLVRKALR